MTKIAKPPQPSQPQDAASTATAGRPRKRAQRTALLLAGSAVLALAACREEQTEAAAFPDEASCIAAAQAGSLFFTEADCRAQFAAAQQEHLETAPRYASRELCEQEHGAGACGADPAATGQQGGGSIFMPLLMGYMIGSMLGGRGGVTQQPLVRNASGGFSNPSGRASFATNAGAGRVAQGTFTRGPTTMGQPAMTQAQVAQRGGFGASNTSRGGAGRSVGG
ncbi:MAG: DUF1190 domain-containing protein [Paracoccus sp. (in: a-proteobacteria)]|nr:DUF1190 domain-containing protein [Paracoccus sp. (in: a-proteobacteria)]